jgi:hypothetical protein
MDSKRLWTFAAVSGLALSGCGGHHSAPAASIAPPPTDFASFVSEQVQMQPPFGTAPAVTDSLGSDQRLGDATAFASVSFGAGDAVPAGTLQAAAACTQAGKTACDPGTSADLNSTLN